MSDFYIPTIGPPIFLQQNRQKHECRIVDIGLAVSFPGIYVLNFRYTVYAVQYCTFLIVMCMCQQSSSAPTERTRHGSRLAPPGNGSSSQGTPSPMRGRGPAAPPPSRSAPPPGLVTCRVRLFTLIHAKN